MNIIDFFKKVAEIFNAENRCGFCWNFGAPLSESGINTTRLTEENKCCVNLFIANYETKSGYEYNTFHTIKRKYCDHVFELYAVQSVGSLGLNVYNEIPNHNVDESLWKTILKPIQNCLGCGNEFDLCELGYDFDIIQWNMKVVRFKEDQNYTGWKITGTFRQTIN